MSETIRVGIGVSGWVVEFTAEADHWLDFKAWKVVGWNGETEEAGLLFAGRQEIEAERADANIVASGLVKWDGCSEWRWPTDDWHLCGVEDALDRVALFKAVFDYAAKHYQSSAMHYRLEWPK